MWALCCNLYTLLLACTIGNTIILAAWCVLYMFPVTEPVKNLVLYMGNTSTDRDMQAELHEQQQMQPCSLTIPKASAIAMQPQWWQEVIPAAQGPHCAG